MLRTIKIIDGLRQKVNLLILLCYRTTRGVTIPSVWPTKEEKKRWFKQTIASYLYQFVFGTTDVSTMVKQVERLDNNAGDRYPCRAPGCDKSYAFHSGRVRLV